MHRSQIVTIVGASFAGIRDPPDREYPHQEGPDRHTNLPGRPPFLGPVDLAPCLWTDRTYGVTPSRLVILMLDISIKKARS